MAGFTEPPLGSIRRTPNNSWCSFKLSVSFTVPPLQYTARSTSLPTFILARHHTCVPPLPPSILASIHLPLLRPTCLLTYHRPFENHAPPSHENNNVANGQPTNHQYVRPASSPPRPYSLATLAAVSQATAVQHRLAPSHVLPTPPPQQPPAHQQYPAINPNGLQYQQPPTRSVESDREMERSDSHEAAMMEDLARRQAEHRVRDMREREQSGGPPIHQPVALPPALRTVHGPNGILSNQGPSQLAHLSGHPVYTSISPHPVGQPPHPPPSLHTPFLSSIQTSNLSLAQQPILNVSTLVEPRLWPSLNIA
jgi:hypothetical protein